MGELRTCTKCGAEKPLADFARDARGKSGRRARCKPCRYDAYREWKQTPEGKAVRLAGNRAYEERNRERLRAKARAKYHANKPAYYERTYKANASIKGRARQSVHNAVRVGTMEKPTVCERCGASEPPHRIHAHHHDYSRPRDVEWLCSICHGKEHRAA